MSQWVFETGPQFFIALFGNAEFARRNLETWLCRSNSEFSVDCAIVAVYNCTPVGAVIALSGAEIPARRRADWLSLISISVHRRDFLKQNFHRFAQVAAPVEPSDYYIRSLAVDRGYRRRGIGRALLEKAIGLGAAAGFSRFRLDVEKRNEPALQLYRSRGFEIVYESEIPEFGFGTYSMRLQFEAPSASSWRTVPLKVQVTVAPNCRHVAASQSCQAGRREAFENLAPGRIILCTAAMAVINDD